MTQLTGPQKQALHHAILTTFPTKPELEQLVYFHLEQNIEVITRGDNLSFVVFELIQWAEANNRLKELTSAAAQEKPHSIELQALHAAFNPSGDSARFFARSEDALANLCNALLSLDYFDHVLAFKTSVKTQSASAFLIHGLDDHDLQHSILLLLKRLIHNLHSATVTPVHTINLARRVHRRDVPALWRELARILRMGADAPPSAIASKVAARLQNEDMVLMFEDLDRIDFSQLVSAFCLPLTRFIRDHQLQSPVSKYKLVMFLIDYDGGLRTMALDLTGEEESAEFPTRLPLITQFTHEDLDQWIRSVIDRWPDSFVDHLDPVAHKVGQILEQSDNGVPERVIEQICILWGCNIHEGVYEWLRS